jgi:hypothetical protein
LSVASAAIAPIDIGRGIGSADPLSGSRLLDEAFKIEPTDVSCAFLAEVGGFRVLMSVLSSALIPNYLVG